MLKWVCLEPVTSCLYHDTIKRRHHCTSVLIHEPSFGQGRPYRGGGVGGCDTPPFISFVGKICCCRQIQGKGENEKGEERKEGKEKEKRKGKERKENEERKREERKRKRKKGKEKREKEKKKLEKKERKRKEKMREDRKGVCHWQVNIVLSANVGL